MTIEHKSAVGHDTPHLHSKRIWDRPTRIAHWLFPLLLASSWWSAHSDALQWHILSGSLLLGLLVFRLFWGFWGGSTARFKHFLRGPAVVWYYVRSEALSRRGVVVGGHNPLGGWSVIALLGCMTAMVVTGSFAVDSDSIKVGPLARFVSRDTGLAAAGLHTIA